MTDLLQRLGETLLTGQPEELKERTREALDAGLSAKAILQQGMMPAMERLGERFSKGEAFLPELLFAAVKMNTATEVLRSAIVGDELKPLGTLLLGTVAGDIHDLGKNLVRMTFEGAGFAVRDLGVNVPAQRFLQAYTEEKPDLVGLSALLTTTMEEMAVVIEEIRRFDARAKFIVGGQPIRQEFADRIGADGYAPDAYLAVKLGKKLLGLE
jgi:5-methyltetrahydrofolate--homocysteine methyltransferase